MRSRRLSLAASTCAGLAAVLLVGAMVLNGNALSAENGIVSDEAFGPDVTGILLAVAVGAISARSALSASTGSPVLVIVLSLLLFATAGLGAFLVLSEPAVFNADYGCLGRTAVWLAAAMRPTPAPCGYLIPSADDSLFYPAALASLGAAALGLACAILTRTGRARLQT